MKKTRLLFSLTMFLILGAAMAQAKAWADMLVPDPALPGIPRIECRIITSTDSLYFRGNDYLPNTLTVTVRIKNVTADTAKKVVACMVQDTRFNVASNPCTDTILFLLGYDSIDVQFVLNVAAERMYDGYDTVKCLATSINGANATAEYRVWVEHEYFPIFRPVCTRFFTQIVFDDKSNEYSPNPFTIQVDVSNIRDGVSDSTFVQYLGTRGVSLDTTDTIGSIKQIGTLNPGERKSVEFFIRAVKRTNDTTVRLCFQVAGKGGYKRKTYIDSCCVDVFIPQAKQAEYQLSCDVIPDLIGFINHRYQPDPFEYKVDITNIGTANGQVVEASISLPPSLELNTGETPKKLIDSTMITGNSRTVSWWLRPALRFKRDTLDLCSESSINSRTRVWSVARS